MAPNTPISEATYRPLVGEEIRLIRLGQQADSPVSIPSESSTGSSDGDGLVECTIEYHQLSRAPPYVALSYCWGDEELKPHLTANGRVYEVGANAKEALLHLREEGDVHVWIDQLCINQHDPAEKSQQVQLMWHIYSSAEQVVAWLGLPADDSDFIMEHLVSIATLLRGGDHKEVIRMHSDPSVLLRASLAFRSFCLREYWRRLWIIQEFSVARKAVITCGHAKLEYTDLRDALLYINNRPSQIASPDDAEQQLPGYLRTRAEMMRAFRTSANSFLEGVLSRRRRYQLRLMSTRPGALRLAGWEEDIIKQRETLFRVLVSTLVLEIDYNHPEASNPSDRIFSVLHFADDKSEFAEFPDYERRCEEIYEDAARRMLMQGHIDVLSYCQFPRETALATWAPDWRMAIRKPCTMSPWFGKFCASGDTLKDQVVRAPDSNTITLRGVLVDSIKQLGRVWDPDWLARLDCGAALAYVAEIRDLCASSPRHRAKGEGGTDVDVDAVRIAIADRYNYREEERQPELLEGYRLAVEYMEASASGTDPHAAYGLRMEDEIGWQAPWYAFCLKNLHSRRPFVSETGYVGLAPAGAVPGDHVVIFLGGRVAYVVREVEVVGGAAAAWGLVGECYMHGVMYGEFMEGGSKVRTFTLR